MRSSNPFSPGFGSPPEVFFGRRSYLGLLDEAITSKGSRLGSFFLEGLRGSGKTVLLHRMAEEARSRSWHAIETHSRHAANELEAGLASLQKRRKTTATLSPHLELSSGAKLSVGTLSSEPVAPPPAQLLSRLMVERAAALLDGQGILVTVDEAQKLSANDAEELCIAVQSALIQQLPVVLVLAGLPRTKDRVSAHKGCTFMRRSRRVILELLGKDETRKAICASFALVPEIALSTEDKEQLAAFSQGHPYLIQLVGDALYHLMDELYGASIETGIEHVPAGPGELKLAEDRAFELYRAHVLSPVLDQLGPKTKRYLLALGETMDEQGLMRSDAELAQALGKQSTSDLSSVRARLIEGCILGKAGNGYLRLRLPYALRYLRHEAEVADAEEFEGLADPWPVRE